MSIYALACRDAPNLGTPERVTLYFTESALRLSTTRTDEQVDLARADVLADLASRLANPNIQITIDGHAPYAEAIAMEFGEVAYAQLIKDYGVVDSLDASPTARRYSPNKVLAQRVRVISGNPDPDYISTSHVERNNLSMRMGMRRFTRLTNGFSKKVENHAAMVSLHFMAYNFAKPHGSLGKNTTPAMAAGVTDHVWTCDEIAALLG